MEGCASSIVQDADYTRGPRHAQEQSGVGVEADWWFPLYSTGLNPAFCQLAPGTDRAWTGTNPLIEKWAPDRSLVLYKTAFDNPQPDVKLDSISYVSTETMTCPFTVGLTVE